MSTSDPDRPTDDATTPEQEPPADAQPATAETAKTPAPAETTEPAQPAKAEEPAAPAEPASPAAPTPPSEPAADTGRHATVRPAPTPPPAREAEAQTATFAPVPARVSARTEPTPTAAGAAGPAAAPATVVVPATQQPEPDTGTKPQPVVAPQETTFNPPPPADDELFPDPNAPRSTSVLAHVLGAIVGLVLGPAAAGTLLLGQARILEAQADGWTATVDTMGIVLVGAGLLLLGWVVLLGIWTPAVPITAGIVLSALGGVALVAPHVARDVTLQYVDSAGWHLTITQVLVAGTSGTLLTAGFLLLLAGIVAATVRRRGIRLGEFRERHR
ncbi:MAG: hypothetical protein AAGC49_05100 [Brevundimonas sp.]